MTPSIPVDIALTREVSPAIGRCELTCRPRAPIDFGLAVAQHEAYCASLSGLGLDVLRLPAHPDCPDCCFVEDTAVVLDELAILGRPGAPSRRPELPAVEAALHAYRTVQRIEAPATLDGGDVLAVERDLYVGLSTRTNAEGLAALRRIVEPLGYGVTAVEVKGCLHLKSAVTWLGGDALLACPHRFDAAALRRLGVIEVAADEPEAANILAVRGRILAHAGFPRTADLLAARGYDLLPLDVSEFLKAEAGVTCKSLLLRRG